MQKLTRSCEKRLMKEKYFNTTPTTRLRKNLARLQTDNDHENVLEKMENWNERKTRAERNR